MQLNFYAFSSFRQFLVEGLYKIFGLLSAAMFSFKSYSQRKYSQLYKLAMKPLSVLASSFPFERFYFQGGIMMCSHRTRLGAETLS